MTLVATRRHVLASVVLALVLTIPSTVLAQHDLRSSTWCGSDPTYWVCGQIIVNPIAGANISQILLRHGGSPSDIIDEHDLGDYGKWYLISVPEGHEVEAVAAYSSDPEVEYAELDRVYFLPPEPGCEITCQIDQLEQELLKSVSDQRNMTSALQAQIRDLEALILAVVVLSLASISLSVLGLGFLVRRERPRVGGRPPRL